MEDPGRGLLVFLRHLAYAGDRASAVLRGGRGGGRKRASDFLIFLRAEHRKQAGDFGLVTRETGSGSGDAPERFFVGLIRVKSCAVRPSTTARTENRERPLGNVLMDRVVGKARERVNTYVEVHFGLVRAAGFAELQNAFGDAFELCASERLLCPGDFHFAKATPTLTLRKRDGDAPWPVPMVCIGWPSCRNSGVPQSASSSDCA